MRPSACLYNLGRGNAIDERALVQALESGRIAHAFLDVFEHEPLASSSPLWSLPNVIVTPHTAGHSGGNKGRVAELFLENLERFARS